MPRVEKYQQWERRSQRRADDSTVLRAFAPIDKRALGVAVGIVAGAALFAVTAFHVLFRPTNALQLALLNQYFSGYEVSWRGALVGLCWGFLTGFVAGWFLAFTRNLVMAMMVFTFKIKGDLANTRDFLDHI